MYHSLLEDPLDLEALGLSLLSLLINLTLSIMVNLMLLTPQIKL